MKAFIVFVCIVGAAVAESCNGTDTTSCALEICIVDHVPTCEKGICTCNPAPDPAACTYLSDCNVYWQSHHCKSDRRHCENDLCVCKHDHGHHG